MIAVVGGGVSGLVAAYLLARRHEVVLFEAAPYLGGHTYTVEVEEEDRRFPVDIGFIVHNERNYPLLLKLFAELGIETADSEMSFSVSCETTGLEWNGSSLSQLFARRSNLLRPSFYGFLLEILRFHRRAPHMLATAGGATLGEALEAEGFRGRFVDHYLVPMTAAIWSTDPRRMLASPATAIFSFLDRHGMLQVEGRPQWRYIPGGSRRYVDALAGQLGPRLRTGAPVGEVRRDGDGVEIVLRSGERVRADHVVFATHSDQALALLVEPTEAERRVLGAIPYQDNEVVLHTDRSFLPRRRRAWASWNAHLGTHAPGGAQVTYYMNRLQCLDTPRPYCVTLNRTREIEPGKILHVVSMAHPLFDGPAVRARERWTEISRGRTHFCGAYWGDGFHEDGVWSAARVAEALGVSW